MTQHVPPETKIRRRSIPHVDLDRLRERHDHLAPLVTTNEGTRTFESRMEWMHRAAEYLLIRNELERRNTP